MKGATYHRQRLFDRGDERTANLDVEGRRESSWHERKRIELPNLHKAIDATWDRLNVELDEGKRTEIQILQAKLAALVRYGHDYTDEQLAEQLAIIEGM